jgi:GST-like protein
LKLNPNNKIPTLVVQETGRPIIESGAILIYLAETHGKFLSTDPDIRLQTIEWLMWQMGGPGPMFGQTHHYAHFNSGKAPYAEERFIAETHRLYGVLNTRLDGRDYVAGDYSIADIACWPWFSRFEWHQLDFNDYPNVRDWYLRIAERPAVQRGYDVPKKVGDIPMP